MFKPPPCEDCGPHSVLHRVDYLGAIVSDLNRSLTGPCDALWRNLARWTGFSASEHGHLLFLKTLERLHLGVFAREPHPHECSRTRAIREEAEARGIDLQEFRILGKDSNYFVARWKDETLVFEAVPRPKGIGVADWMDDKHLMRTAFRKAGIPIANGDVCFLWSTAARWFEQLEKPLIVKPHIGSRSRHTTIHINTLEELRVAFKKAKRLSPWIILEEELVGDLYRGTVIGGKAIATIRREAPRVIGNGVSTIRRLLEVENALPIRHAGVFEPIPIDGDTEGELHRQGLTWDSVPAEGTRVVLNPKFGRGQGSLNTDVTDITHPDNLKLLEDAARVINDPLIGMDFIMSDITRSWKDQRRAGIIECNSAPFIDIHHYPYAGQPRNTAGVLWELCFPGSGK